MLCRTLGHCAQRESLSDIIQRNSVGKLKLEQQRKRLTRKKATLVLDLLAAFNQILQMGLDSC